jgi:hypothetical protein
MSEELEPCPFCNCYGERRFDKYYFFHKKDCVFSDLSDKEQSVTAIKVTDTFGIEKWNTRKPVSNNEKLEKLWGEIQARIEFLNTFKNNRFIVANQIKELGWVKAKIEEMKD